MKLQVTMDDEAVERLDLYAKKMGVSRSALCAVLIGQGIMAYDKSYEVIEKAGTRAIMEQSRDDKA